MVGPSEQAYWSQSPQPCLLPPPHSIPVGGGNAPFSCLPTTNKNLEEEDPFFPRQETATAQTQVTQKDKNIINITENIFRKTTQRYYVRAS